MTCCHAAAMPSSGVTLLTRARNSAPSIAPMNDPRPPVITAPPRKTAAKQGSV